MLDIAMAAYVSDLFFNLDHNDAKVTDEKGHFTGWDTDKMRQQARWFRNALDHIMMVDPPTVDSILSDFYGRN
jgi:hypothetical protein